MTHTEQTDTPRRIAPQPESLRSEAVVVAPASPPSLARFRRWPAVAVAAALLVGAGLRLATFASDRPLWIDEAMIALNLTDRDVGQLFEPLDHNQTAPVAFLLAGKLCVTAFGPAEYALRLPAFVGSLAGLLLFAVAAFRLLPAPSARLAVLLFALSPTVVSYAGEVKQYSIDAAVTAALLVLVAPCLRELTPARLAALAAGGTAAVWVSHPAVFVLASVGSVLFVQALRQRRRRLALLAVGTAWVASFAAVYWVNVRFGTSNPYLAEYWKSHFLPLSPTAGLWVVERTADLFHSAGGYGGLVFQAAGLAAAVATGGGLCLWRDGRRAEAALLAGVFAFTLLASALHKYPLVGRLLLFLVPAAVLFLAHGTAVVAGAVWGRSKALAVVLTAAVVFAPATEVWHQLRHPDRVEELPAAVQFVRERWRPGDRVYVYNGDTDVGAGPAFEFYNRRQPLPADAVILGGVYRDDSRGYRTEITTLAATPGRVWVLFSHLHADDKTWVRAYFDGVGERGEEFRSVGAAVYCYHLR